ncbi:telomerase reverse transcriptase-like [Asterias amurensis]|uniref:telomerase reverse transcriptase-like n=1 Tax=Asterias amurensis TaxID=7602 RepID=UPI003AB6DBB2
MEVLQKIYPKLLPLQDYLKGLGCEDVVREDDKPGFKIFMEKTFVGESANCPQFRGKVTSDCPAASLDDVIQDAVLMIKSRTKEQSVNVLTFGKVKEGGQTEKDNQDLVNVKLWKMMLGKIGVDVVMYLLTNTSVFLFAPPSCYIQACGFPIFDLCPWLGQKRKCEKEKSPWRHMGKDISVFPKICVCYCKTGFKRIWTDHVLSTSPATTPGAILLLNAIFPFGKTVRESLTQKNVLVKRTKKRFVALQKILRNLLTNYKKCNIIKLLKAHCPVSRSKVKNALPSEIMESLVKSKVEPWKVFLFLRRVVKRVVPLELWGSKHNQSSFFKFVEKFVKIGRSSKLNVECLIDKMETADLKWAVHQVVKDHPCCHSVVMTKDKMIKTVMSWIMSQFVISLIRSAFYITETSTSRTGIVYYRKTTWSSLEKLALEDCRASGKIKEITSREAESYLSVSGVQECSSLRFIPKKNSLRLITLPAKGAKAGQKPRKVHNPLENIYNVLRMFRHHTPSQLGSSLFGVSDAYPKWKRFVSETRKQSDRPLYFVKVDIMECFDSIPHSELRGVIANVLRAKHDRYWFVIYNYATVANYRGQPRKRFHRNAFLMTQFVDPLSLLLLQMAKEERLKNTIFVNRVTSFRTTAETLLNTMSQHVEWNIVKFAGSHFLKKKGIPQGSIISSFLCNYFYAAMEKEHLPYYGKDELLMRLLDDFLFVTPHLENAQRFLTLLLNGLPSYGCHTNTAKTLTNFPFVHDGKEVKRLEPSELFPWCGLLINTETLGVANDYTRYKDVSISHTMIVNFTDKDVLPKVKTKVLQLLRSKCNKFFLDPEINFPEIIKRNCYEFFLISAFRLHSQLKVLQFKEADKAASKLMDILFRLTDQLPHMGCTLKKQQVKWLCMKAFETKLQRHHSRYRILLRRIKKTKKRAANCLAEQELLALEVATSPSMPQAFKEMKT